MAKIDVTRRALLSRIVVGSAVLIPAAALLACGGGSDGGEGGAGTAAKGASCDDISGLAPADVAMRKQLQYVDVSADAAKSCDACQLYTVPAAGAACGGCQAVKGPISPKGTCVAWAKKVG